MMCRQKQLALVMAAAVSLCFPFPSPAAASGELPSGYMTVVDENGDILLETGLAVQAGDWFISEDNHCYEIIRTDGNAGTARLSDLPAAAWLPAIPVQAPPAAPGDNTAPAEPPPAPEGSPSAPPLLVALYHTHTDEAYVPSDGTATIPAHGSIIQVGEAMAGRLRELGVEADHDVTPHDPHDANAYQRSRRTFTDLLAKQPAALFDIHRDSAPLPFYKTTINGQEVSKILLVVGWQNQNRATSMNWAQTIKAAADRKYRGLVRGIFVAHGNYNQDLSPRAMLLEIGTQYNSLDEAQHSAALFADIVPSLLSQIGAAPPPVNTAGTTGTAAPPPSRGIGYDFLFLAGVVIVGSAAYLYLSTGSWQEVRRRLAAWRYEFIHYLGPGRRRRKS